MGNNKNNNIMEHPFAKSTSITDKVKHLLDIVTHDDVMAILINADPDAMASAMALKRLFWRRVRKFYVFHTNVIKRADNLAMINLLKFDQRHINHIKEIKNEEITKWAIVDSQPSHNDQLEKYEYDIIIDHHPVEFLQSLALQPFQLRREDHLQAVRLHSGSQQWSCSLLQL